jgi:DNA-binding XRE family transcriptional regulator
MSLSKFETRNDNSHLTLVSNFETMVGMEHPLATYRKQLGFTLTQMGILLGCTRGTAHKWEHGIAPAPKTAQKIARITNGMVPLWSLRPDIWPPPGSDKEAAE